MSGFEGSILLLLPSLRTGGAEHVLIRIANDLAATGASVVLVAFDGTGNLRDRISTAVTFEELSVARTRYAFPKLLAAIRKCRPRVIVSTLTRASLLLLLMKPFLPEPVRIVIRQPNLPSKELDHLQPRLLYRFLFPRLIPRADTIISQSRTMTEDLRRWVGMGMDRVVTIHNPAPAVDWRDLRSQPSPVDNGTNFVVLGRLSIQKGQDVAVAALPALIQRVPDAKLVFIGEGPLRADLERQVKKLGMSDHVRFTGYIADPLPWLAHANALVLPSRWEGFPNALLEAIACGTPVVATDCGGVSAEIVTTGKNGVIVPCGDPAAMADAMVTVVRLNKAHGPADIAASAAPFAPEKIFAEYRRVVTEAAGTAQ